ncbi:MAG: hypothetical protein SOZ47_05995 [Lawsonibacter sp.]|nr:hypothetical protein [Lawsonibacter sp.]
MSCKQKRQLVRFPKVRILKQWFRHFNDHKEFHNEGNLHLFSLMALFSYANFRSNERVINGVRYMEAPGQWVCKLGSLPRILRVHSKAQALDLMKYFEEKGFLQFEVIDEDQEIIRYTINDWKRHCTHLAYNYYSYKGSGFFFFPLPIGRLLLRAAKTEGRIVFSELDALMDMWLHTIVNDPSVKGSEYMPVVYYSNMHGMPLLSYTYLAKRWGWSKSRVGRFKVRVWFGEEFCRDDMPYRVIICRCRKRDVRAFMAAASELTNKMLLCGYPDYPAFCDGLKQSIIDRREMGGGDHNETACTAEKAEQESAKRTPCQAAR